MESNLSNGENNERHFSSSYRAVAHHIDKHKFFLILNGMCYFVSWSLRINTIMSKQLHMQQKKWTH